MKLTNSLVLLGAFSLTACGASIVVGDRNDGPGSPDAATDAAKITLDAGLSPLPLGHVQGQFVAAKNQHVALGISGTSPPVILEGEIVVERHDVSCS